jgi:hypothetical protein
MGYRGRLIFPMTARILRMDTATMTEAAFDDVFREPIQVPDGTQSGHDARVDMAPLDLPAQVEDQDWKTLSMEMTGNDPRTTVTLVFHMRDLEARGLLHPTTKNALCPAVGDRLDAIVDPRSGAIMRMAPDPGVYCVSAVPRSYGLSGLQGNLIVATFVERSKSKAV